MPKYELTITHNDGSTRIVNRTAPDMMMAANFLLDKEWTITGIVLVEPQKPKQRIISMWVINNIEFRIACDGEKFYLYNVTGVVNHYEKQSPDPSTCLLSDTTSDALLLAAVRIANS